MLHPQFAMVETSINIKQLLHIDVKEAIIEIAWKPIGIFDIKYLNWFK